MSKVTLGGDRLGSGGKNEIELKSYGRSTHDLSFTWRSTMSAGTLVPFMTELALPGDSFDIDLEVDMKTIPTLGPLFGSYKVQLDVFVTPIRLYNGKLHMNMLGIGMKMDTIKFPLIDMHAWSGTTGDNRQINASSIWSHLNIRGLGTGTGQATQLVNRKFNAIPYLAYWDIYKNYYANKQEEIGVVIHNSMNNVGENIEQMILEGETGNITLNRTLTPQECKLGSGGKIQITMATPIEPDPSEIRVVINTNGNIQKGRIDQIFTSFSWNIGQQTLTGQFPLPQWGQSTIVWLGYEFDMGNFESNVPKLTTFPLENIDEMRQQILANVASTSAFEIDTLSLEPYNLSLKQGTNGFSKLSTQEGLAIKTYQSDLFNNWVSTEWIDGSDGINALTAIDTSTGSFTIDTLQLSRKVYDMFNRIAVSGGSYDDWLNAVYTHDRTRSVENPIYMGGLIRELAFQEVVSNASIETETTNQPLGTMAGKGVLTKKNKGGKVTIKVDEPSYIMGIISLTPRLDYSQGNKWDVNLKTMDDLHKPALDEIGFQDLLTDQMAWWDTVIDSMDDVQFKSAGKVPAWINYMTNQNVTRGNFAVEGMEMFMSLNRKYEEGKTGIKDLTTYIDPSKFNNIFADERLDAQNFWAQISVGIKARRKMSNKIMPNL